jgi:hypothetical protein
MRIYLAWWRDRPAFSRAYFLELPSAGPRAIEQRANAQARFVALFVALAQRARPDDPASEVTLRVFVGGMTDLVAEEVRAGRLAQLSRLEGELVGLTVRTLETASLADLAA